MFGPRGLRARTATGFALSALGLSLLLALATYQLARWYLLEQRQRLAVRQAGLHAQVLSGQLASSATTSDEQVLAALAQTRGRAVLAVDGTWYSAVVDLDESRIPSGLIEGTLAGEALIQRTRIGGTPYFVVGVPIPAEEAHYFEFLPAEEYERTLRTLAIVLTSAASVTTVIGGVAGFGMSRRVLRPLHSVASTAQAMSEGQLDRRLSVGDDRDLEPVAEAFNNMAESLEQRIAREQRFTADVSHELRTPLTAMSAAVALARRSGSSERTAMALDIVAEQAEHLQELTLELLELARVDAGVVEGDRELVDVAELVERQAALHGMSAVFANSPGIPVVHEVNPVRFGRVVANLLENAARYAGGATRIECRHVGGRLRLVVDDEGPGVPADERLSIFGRFHRGASVAGGEHPKGTGLGLSLVDEYARLDGGRVWVEDRPGGGARFVVELPAQRDR
jgi:signal transduction histidine kinase